MKTNNLKITFNAPVTLGFVFLSFAVLAAGALTRGMSTQMLFMTWHSSLLNPLTWLRFFTHVLGHAGWQHYVGNMSYILLLGPMLEEKYGSSNIVFVILATALVTGLVYVLFFPNTVILGASGIVFAFIILSSITGFRERTVPLTFLLVAALYLGQQIYNATQNNNVAELAHIAGGVVGGSLGFVMKKNKMDRYHNGNVR
jgi:GlpG protein